MRLVSKQRLNMKHNKSKTPRKLWKPQTKILATGDVGEVTDVVDNKETGNIEIEV